MAQMIVYVARAALLEPPEKPYPTATAPWPPTGPAGGASGKPALRDPQKYLIEKLGEDGYRTYLEHRKAKLRGPVVDWRFWTGLALAGIALAVRRRRRPR